MKEGIRIRPVIRPEGVHTDDILRKSKENPNGENGGQLGNKSKGNETPKKPLKKGSTFEIKA